MDDQPHPHLHCLSVTPAEDQPSSEQPCLPGLWTSTVTPRPGPALGSERLSDLPRPQKWCAHLRFSLSVPLPSSHKSHSALACQLCGGGARVNQTQPSGSPQLGVGEVGNPQPSWQGGLRGKGSPSQGPCRTLDSARCPCAAGQPPFENLRAPSVPHRLPGLSPSPTLTGGSCQRVCRQRATSSRAAVRIPTQRPWQACVCAPRPPQKGRRAL